MTLSKIGKVGGIVGVLAGSFVLLSGFAAGKAGHGWQSPDKVDKFVTFRVNDMLDDIKATPDQRTKVLAAKDKILSEFLANRETRREAHQAIVAQWKSDAPNAKAIHDSIDAQFDRMRALAHDAANQALEIHAVLTPEQREQVAGRLAGGRMFEP